MEKKEKPVIMYDSPEAATGVSLKLADGTSYGKGWVSTNRRFYPNEQLARQDSATHKKCDGCGAVIDAKTFCSSCASKKRSEAYFKMPYEKWDGDGMLTLHDDDQFFSDESDVWEYCENNELGIESLHLVICEPNYLHKLDGSEWADIMPEDGDGELPKEVEEALIVFNAVISKQGPVSWSAGKFRTSLAKEDEDSAPSDERNTSNDDSHDVKQNP